MTRSTTTVVFIYLFIFYSIFKCIDIEHLKIVSVDLSYLSTAIVIQPEQTKETARRVTVVGRENISTILQTKGLTTSNWTRLQRAIVIDISTACEDCALTMLTRISNVIFWLRNVNRMMGWRNWITLTIYMTPLLIIGARVKFRAG